MAVLCELEVLLGIASSVGTDCAGDLVCRVPDPLERQCPATLTAGAGACLRVASSTGVCVLSALGEALSPRVVVCHTTQQRAGPAAALTARDHLTWAACRTSGALVLRETEFASMPSLP
ncbi:uncharacterized protein C8Q71DRAFT_760804 [Rhodofomes roseus]|uniref:Secreted protein n=1 Tax=Rhodofomes roseus TaxID=34475 RepID=A0ABQ8KEJ5_9APHY|nr:uncharacterized protein C8Q71DRAFT_760804 [Rhodofomes roseus]KAH9836136.1 hypothetical protein C8Q71DRAFT_760804 [Rhodofomes roseus]